MLQARSQPHSGHEAASPSNSGLEPEVSTKNKYDFHPQKMIKNGTISKGNEK